LALVVLAVLGVLGLVFGVISALFSGNSTEQQ